MMLKFVHKYLQAQDHTADWPLYWSTVRFLPWSGVEHRWGKAETSLITPP
jgi:hypothetical protein